MAQAYPAWLNSLSWLMVVLGVLSTVVVAFDISRREPQPMAVMRYVWPINTLWLGVWGIWIYWKIGRTGPRTRLASAVTAMDMAAMKTNKSAMKSKSGDGVVPPHWRSVVTGTLHCGAGCSLADLVGPFVFRLLPFSIMGSRVFGEWTLDYILALATGVAFQYAALSPMLGQTGLRVWWRALKVDFLSLSSWQVGMYGWMALVIFVWIGPISPARIEFWFLMQLAMACGFLTAFPMNSWLIKKGIKTEM